MRHVSNSLMNWRYMYVSSTYVQYIIRSGVIHRIGCRQTQNTCMKSPTNLRVGGRIIFRIVMPSSESEQFFYFHCGLMLSFSNTNTASRWNVQLSLRFNWLKRKEEADDDQRTSDSSIAKSYCPMHIVSLLKFDKRNIRTIGTGIHITVHHSFIYSLFFSDRSFENNGRQWSGASHQTLLLLLLDTQSSSTHKKVENLATVTIPLGTEPKLFTDAASVFRMGYLYRVFGRVGRW